MIGATYVGVVVSSLSIILGRSLHWVYGGVYSHFKAAFTLKCFTNARKVAPRACAVLCVVALQALGSPFQFNAAKQLMHLYELRGSLIMPRLTINSAASAPTPCFFWGVFFCMFTRALWCKRSLCPRSHRCGFEIAPLQARKKRRERDARYLVVFFSLFATRVVPGNDYNVTEGVPVGAPGTCSARSAREMAPGALERCCAL